LLAHGELCRGCGLACNDSPADGASIEIQDHDDPYKTWKLTECPRKFTQEIVDAVNMAQLAKHHLPSPGGLLDQSAWWMDCWMSLQSDLNQIEADKQERERRRHG
jgi:hypothetical protein